MLGLLVPVALAVDATCEGDMVVSEPCNLKACDVVRDCTPEDATWTEWYDWQPCQYPQFMQERHRNIATNSKCEGQPLHGAMTVTRPCTGSKEEAPCAEEAVPKQLTFRDWSAWSRCECGVEQVYRTRTLDTRGLDCANLIEEGHLKETKACDQAQFGSCDVARNCGYTKWGEWSSCSATCGRGQQTRERSIANSALHGGAGCTGRVSETRVCSEQCCDPVVDCEYQEWQAWGACSQSCDTGYRARSREIAQFTRFGALCPDAATRELQRCAEQPCIAAPDPLDGAWGGWEAWSECTEPCGGGLRSTTRTVATMSRFGGQPVSGPYSKYERCNEEACGVDVQNCEFSDWGDWAVCSCDCNGISMRTRFVTKNAGFGGKMCEGGLRTTRPCNVPGVDDVDATCTRAAKLPCEWSDWSGWSECTATCLGGTTQRSRQPVKDPNHEESCVGVAAEMQACNTNQCYVHEGKQNVDCAWNDWEEWGVCTKPCGGGSKERYRHIQQEAKLLGRPCEAKDSVELATCGHDPCGPKPTFCAWSDWQAWGGCSAECGGGQRTRKQSLVVTETAEGALAMTTLEAMQVKASELRASYTTRLFGSAVLGAGAAMLAAVVFLVRRPQTQHVERTPME